MSFLIRVLVKRESRKSQLLKRLRQEDGSRPGIHDQPGKQ
jgi:hypothetical protein